MSDSDSDSDSPPQQETSFQDLPSDDSCLDDDSDSDVEIDRSSLVPVDEEDDDSDDSESSPSENDKNDEESSDSDAPSERNEEDEIIRNVEKESDNRSLAERLHAKRQNGAEGGRPKRGKSKSNALQIAQARLEKLKQQNKKRKRKEIAASSRESFLQEDTNTEDEADGSEKEEVEGDFEVEKSSNRKKNKKKSKHSPTVASSLRSAYYSRGAPDINASGIGVSIGAHRYKPRDPRMQSLSGHLNQDTFERRYKFLEEIQDEEIARVQDRCKAWKMTGKQGQRARKKLGLASSSVSTAEDDEIELKRLMQERSSRVKERKSRTAKREIKKTLREGVASGKRGAYYLKKRDLKKLEIGQKFDELNEKGGATLIDKTLAKKRKKNMGKASSLMP